MGTKKDPKLGKKVNVYRLKGRLIQSTINFRYTLITIPYKCIKNLYGMPNCFPAYNYHIKDDSCTPWPLDGDVFGLGCCGVSKQCHKTLLINWATAGTFFLHALWRKYHPPISLLIPFTNEQWISSHGVDIKFCTHENISYFFRTGTHQYQNMIGMSMGGMNTVITTKYKYTFMDKDIETTLGSLQTQWKQLDKCLSWKWHVHFHVIYFQHHHLSLTCIH